MLAMTIAITFAFAGSIVSRADTSITVTLRIEQDAATELLPVSVTLTDADKRDFGIGLSTETLTPLHALAKYLAEEKKVADTDMSRYIIASPSSYGLYVTGISIKGDGTGSASVNSDPQVYWNYRVNDKYIETSMDTYELKDRDSIVLYGLWSPYPAEDEVLYTHFDKEEYSAKISDPVSITLTGDGIAYDEAFNAIPYTKAVTGATVTAMELPQKDTSVIQDIYWTATTDQQGKASFHFPKAGKYILSANRMSADGIHCDISRPYAIVNVSDPSTAAPSPSAAPTFSAAPSVIPAPCGGVKKQTSQAKQYKLTKPAKVKAAVKKSKKNRKKITVSWKKSKCMYTGSSGTVTKKVSGYEVLLSEKKNKGYKKIGQTKKTKISFKRKAGNCYVKVRAYKTGSSGPKYYSTFSAPVKIKVR